jgi:UDP-N-acetylmuramate dehydrogenase
MIEENISLQAYNTFGIDAKTRFFTRVAAVDDLQSILSNRRWQESPKLILGEGSNILLTGDFPGLTIKIKIQGIETVKEDDEHVWVRAGAGENWHQLVLYCLDHQYAGIENLSLIPGTVGAAPMQNIGAYGVELTEVFAELTAIHIASGEARIFHHADCHFGYRDSVFKNRYKNQYIISHVTLRLNKKPRFRIDYGALREALKTVPHEELTIKKISDAVMHIRRTKLPDPKVIGNAGSFFKNPVVTPTKLQQLLHDHPELPHFDGGNNLCKIPAAWLIEQCHWKGFRTDDIGVHQHHALVLVNYGKGSGHAIQQLAKEIQASVWEKFAVEITPEVNII